MINENKLKKSTESFLNCKKKKKLIKKYETDLSMIFLSSNKFILSRWLFDVDLEITLKSRPTVSVCASCILFQSILYV